MTELNMGNKKYENEVNGVTATTTYEFQFPKKKDPLTFVQIIYNTKTGECLGRTPKSWFQILAFYVVFYAVLAAMFAICMQGLFSTMNDRKPNYVLNGSLIGSNPGLGFRPVHDDSDVGAVVKYDPKNTESVQYWTKLIDKFLEPYSDSKKPQNQKICNFGSAVEMDKVCAFPLDKLGPCGKSSEAYGFNNSKPCVYLKLNKIFDWVPEYYNDTNELPEEMPAGLKLHIKQIPKAQQNQIWISCKPKNSHDEDEMGPLQFFPDPGFPGYYYPYTNTPGYLSPLVAVQLQRPAHNKLITIECRAWAKNIQYSGALKDRRGSVQFEIIVD